MPLAILMGALFASFIDAQAQPLSVGGTYPTHAVLIAGSNTCGAVTVQDNVTTVTHSAGLHTLSLTHAGTTYDATIDDNGVFLTSLKTLNAGGAQFRIVVDGQFSATGLTATVAIQQTAPTSCSYMVSWTGTKQGASNTIPGTPRDGRSLLVRHFAGTGASASADGPATAAAFSFPIGITLDRKGSLFIADGDFAIRKITPGGIVSTIAGAPGIAGFRDSASGEPRFAGLHGIVVDSHGDLFVTDNPNHAVRRIAIDGTVTTLVGNGTPGSADGTGSAAQLNFPHDLAIDAQDNLYVADVANHIIRKITPAGVMTTFAGQAGQRGSIDGRGSQARFEFPSSMAVDAAGNVWVGGNGTIRRIAPDATVTTIAGVNGVSGSADGQGTAAAFQGPEGLQFAPDGTLYIASGSTLRKMDSEFRVTTIAGLGSVTGDAEGRGSAARLRLPLGIAVNAESRIFFADAQNNRIFSAIPDNLTCAGSPARLCLNQDRFSIMLNGVDAVSRKVNSIYGNFASGNDPKVFVKVLDERPKTDRFSIVYGGLTDDAYTLTALDTTTGLAAPLVHDQNSTCGGFKTGSIPAPQLDPVQGLGGGRRRAARPPCAPDAICLFDDRLRITLRARDPQSGASGDGVPLAGSAFSVPALTGDPNSAEVFLRVIDQRASNGTFSIDYGGMTAFEYTITVTDTNTKLVRQFTQPAESRCGDFTTFAF